MAQASSSPGPGRSALQVVLYWAIVAVPLGWGVYKTVQKSMPLFHPPAAVAPAASPTPVPAVVPVATPAVTPLPSATAMPFGTAQPSETVAPIVTPAQPIN